MSYALVTALAALNSATITAALALPALRRIERQLAGRRSVAAPTPRGPWPLGKPRRGR